MNSTRVFDMDVRRLAGVRRLIGVDLTDTRAHVVELKRVGNFFGGSRQKLSAAKAFTVRFDPTACEEDRSTQLRSALLDANVRARHAVTAVQSVGIKIMSAAVPQGTDSIDEWIPEQYERSLRVPFSAEGISYRYEIVSSGGGDFAEISFARNSDLERIKTFCQQSGLQLIALGAGTRDAFSAFLAEGLLPAVNRFIYINETMISVVSIANGERRQTEYFPIQYDRGQENLKFLEDHQLDDDHTVVAGECAGLGDFAAASQLRCFALPSQFVLAAGLAVKGFYPEMSPQNFLTMEEQRQFAGYIFRRLAVRTVMTLGLTLMLLVVLPALVSWFIQFMIDESDRSLEASGWSGGELSRDEEKVRNLEERLRKRGSNVRRTHAAKILHDVAAVFTDSVWLYKLGLEEVPAANSHIHFFGYAASPEAIAQVLKYFEMQGAGSTVRLLRFGARLPMETLVPVTAGGRAYTTFEAEAVMPAK